MLSLCLFISLALLELSIPATTAAPSPQLTELGDSFDLNNDIIPFDPNYYIPITPYIPTDPLLKAQIDDFSLGSSLEFNPSSEPVILAQINDQGVVPNPDHGNSMVDPDIEAGGTCRKTKSLYCCKGQYNSKTLRVAQPCKLWRTEEAIFCNHAGYYCCQDLDGQTNGESCSPVYSGV